MWQPSDIESYDRSAQELLNQSSTAVAAIIAVFEFIEGFYNRRRAATRRSPTGRRPTTRPLTGGGSGLSAAAAGLSGHRPPQKTP